MRFVYITLLKTSNGLLFVFSKGFDYHRYIFPHPPQIFTAYTPSISDRFVQQIEKRDRKVDKEKCGDIMGSGI